MKSLTLTRGVAMCGAVLLFRASTALAAADESTPLHLPASVVKHSSGSGDASLVRTIVGLFIVIAVIYGISWILRQAKGGKVRARGQGLDQLATLPLGSGRSVALVRAGREVLLVGVAEQGVTPIRSYTEAEAIASGIDLPPEEPLIDGAQRPSRVADLLRRLTVRS